MNNDDWLNNLASSLDLDRAISQDHSAIPTASLDLHQTPDLNKSLDLSRLFPLLTMSHFHYPTQIPIFLARIIIMILVIFRAL